MSKMILAAVSVSVLALHTQSASAQATPVYGSPAQAKTSNEALSTPRLNRVLRERRGFEPFAAAPRQADTLAQRNEHLGQAHAQRQRLLILLSMAC